MRYARVVDQGVNHRESKLTYTQVTNATLKLATMLADYKGETEFLWGKIAWMDSLDEIIIGAFWHYTHSHSGQDSVSYATYCQLNRVYSPGCGGDEEENNTCQGFDRLQQVRPY